jgi:ribonuclease G
MTEEILINVTPQETRVAQVENGVLQELLVERANNQGLVGNIYKGRVSRVLPGMQAAFIEIGLERTAFLHASDIASAIPGSDIGPRDEIPITQLVSEGKQIIVQVIKDPLGSKGARLSTRISLPSRYLVFMPGEDHLGVSIKIEDDPERMRLREAVIAFKQTNKKLPHGGYILRTSAEGASQEAIWADMMFLNKLWTQIADRARSLDPPTLIHGDLPLVLRILRDLLRDNIESVKIDSEEAWQQVTQFVRSFFPHLESRVALYTGGRPIFDLYGVEDEVLRALNRRVELKSGGHLVLDQTEAMTTIDVNTGGYVGHRNPEDTVFKTNLEAAQAIARQLRLRNLGGIIIIDFIDMRDASHKTQVTKALHKAFSTDNARTQIFDISPLGLVEMTRKRTRESLEHILCEPCGTCEGKGVTRTTETISYEIFRELVRAEREFESNEMLVVASTKVTDYMLAEEAKALADLEAATGKPIRLQAESQYLQEQYDVVLL